MMAQSKRVRWLVSGLVLLVGVIVPGQTLSAAEKTVMVADFSRLNVSGPYVIQVETGKSPSVRILASPRQADGVTVSQTGQALIIRPNNSIWNTGDQRREDGPITLMITVPMLSEVGLTGSGRLTINRLKGMKVRVLRDGVGIITVGMVDADQLEVLAQGPGETRVSGKAANARFVLRGPAVINAEDLLVSDAKVEAMGSGVLRLQASRTAAIAAEGPAMIELKGEADCLIERRGGAEVRCETGSRPASAFR